MRKTRSGGRASRRSRNAAPSANSIVSTPVPCRISDTKCRMLLSSSMMKQAACGARRAAAVASVGVGFAACADIGVSADDRTRASGHYQPISAPQRLIIGCEQPCGCRYSGAAGAAWGGGRSIRRQSMPSNMRFMNPPAIAKPGGYSHVVEITGPGRIVYIAGQLGLEAGRQHRRRFPRPGGAGVREPQGGAGCGRRDLRRRGQAQQLPGRHHRPTCRSTARCATSTSTRRSRRPAPRSACRRWRAPDALFEVEAIVMLAK